MVKKLNLKESNSEPKYKFIFRLYNEAKDWEYTKETVVTDNLGIKHIWETALDYALDYSEMTGDELTELVFFAKLS